MSTQMRREKPVFEGEVLVCEAVDAGEQSLADEKMRRQLLKNFGEDNQTTFNDIAWYIDARDTKRAYRLAHRLGVLHKCKRALARAGA